MAIAMADDCHHPGGHLASPLRLLSQRRCLVQRSQLVILSALVLAVVDIFDLSFAFRTGRARGRYGTITRKGQPRRFWRYVYGGCAVLLFCAGVILWALISPDSF
jgi:hypothetical protein